MPGSARSASYWSLETNLNTSSLTAQQKVEVMGAVESSIVKNTLQTEGVVSEGDMVTVTDIVGKGVVLVSVDSSNTPEIAQSLFNPSSLMATAEAIQAQAPGASDASLAAMMTAIDVIAFKPAGTPLVAPVAPATRVFGDNSQLFEFDCAAERRGHRCSGKFNCKHTSNRGVSYLKATRSL